MRDYQIERRMIDDIWRDTLETLKDFYPGLAETLRLATLETCTDERWILSFPVEATFARERMEDPDKMTKLEWAVYETL